MCYETALTKMKSQVQEYFHKDFAFPDKYEPYYHQSGFSHPNLQIIKMDTPELIYPAQWGYVPSWGMKDIAAFRKKYNTLNIRSETLFKGVSKEAAHEKRCLIIADGFFEPHNTAGISIPYFCYIPSINNDPNQSPGARPPEEGVSSGSVEHEEKYRRDLFVFGGIYSGIDDQFTCSILTMKANPFFAEVHNIKKRQPFVIDEGLYNEWFNPDLKEENVLELIKNGFTSKEFKAHPVSTDLYKRNIDTNKPSILEETSPPNLLF